MPSVGKQCNLSGRPLLGTVIVNMVGRCVNDNKCVLNVSQRQNRILRSAGTGAEVGGAATEAQTLTRPLQAAARQGAAAGGLNTLVHNGMCMYWFNHIRHITIMGQNCRRRPGRGRQLAAWIRAILHSHAAHLQQSRGENFSAG